MAFLALVYHLKNRTFFEEESLIFGFTPAKPLKLFPLFSLCQWQQQLHCSSLVS
jgi:hypothetical protein